MDTLPARLRLLRGAILLAAAGIAATSEQPRVARRDAFDSVVALLASAALAVLGLRPRLAEFR
ncbi:hypothetical protein [Streptomyces sp. NPDC051909]|uniref:hypothetical protein n=1 Tax=Streptomyces sp. NPDC051909 TaxID=3154944 RepID=UPI003412E09E